MARRAEINHAKNVWKRDLPKNNNAWKRDLSGRANGTIDEWYECYLYDEMMDYAINFTFPWSKHFIA